jgi:hypothetical protein
MGVDTHTKIINNIINNGGKVIWISKEFEYRIINEDIMRIGYNVNCVGHQGCNGYIFTYG